MSPASATSAETAPESLSSAPGAPKRPRSAHFATTVMPRWSQLARTRGRGRCQATLARPITSLASLFALIRASSSITTSGVAAAPDDERGRATEAAPEPQRWLTSTAAEDDSAVQFPHVHPARRRSSWYAAADRDLHAASPSRCTHAWRVGHAHRHLELGFSDDPRPGHRLRTAGGEPTCTGRCSRSGSSRTRGCASSCRTSSAAVRISVRGKRPTPWVGAACSDRATP